MSYNYQTQYDSPNYTPGAQTRGVWGVDRDVRAIAIHWWGDPSTDPTFDGVVKHLCDPASQVSAHFVATGTGRQVACLVDMDDNAWATVQENPYSVAIECDPRCRDEDYDVVAELIADIRAIEGRDLPLVPHSQYVSTRCPGDWDLGRLDGLARTKVSNGRWGGTAAAPAPAAVPTPVPVVLQDNEHDGPVDVTVVTPTPAIPPAPAAVPVVEPPAPTPSPTVPAPQSAKSSSLAKAIESFHFSLAGATVLLTAALADPSVQNWLALGLDKYVTPALLGLGLSTGLVTFFVTLIKSKLTRTT